MQELVFGAIVLQGIVAHRCGGIDHCAEEAMTETAPRKKTKSAPITLSARASDEILKIIRTKQLPDGYALRVGVRGGGCSGMSYILGFDRKREHDKQYDIDGITVYLDKRQGLYLMGTTVDYHDGLNARGFTFDNPNAVSTCGCGSSFGV